MTRIIAGNRKGQNLQAPKGGWMRPTTDRAKEWIFSVLQDVRDIRVLDLFCGAGNLGIEALSRGAEHCTFVDQSSKAVAITRENLHRTGYDESMVTVVKMEARHFLEQNEQAFPLILADPPYDYTDISSLISLALHRLTEQGVLVVEYSDTPQVTLPEGYEQLRTESLGRTTITIYGSVV